jgi:hypothetical protein
MNDAEYIGRSSGNDLTPSKLANRNRLAGARGCRFGEPAHGRAR